MMKTSIFTRISRAFIALIVVSVLLGSAPSKALAYGNDALWQIGLSFNCNDPSLCLTPPFGVGGLWGWIEFDTGGEGDATLAGCTHLSSSLGLLTGADYLRIEITNWTIGPGSAGPATFLITAGTVTFAGVNTKGRPVTVPLSALLPPGATALDLGVPAVAGHYSYSSLFGFTPPPGVNFQIQVVQITH
jgi:hypothetical protein